MYMSIFMFHTVRKVSHSYIYSFLISRCNFIYVDVFENKTKKEQSINYKLLILLLITQKNHMSSLYSVYLALIFGLKKINITMKCSIDFLIILYKCNIFCNVVKLCSNFKRETQELF